MSDLALDYLFLFALVFSRVVFIDTLLQAITRLRANGLRPMCLAAVMLPILSDVVGFATVLCAFNEGSSARWIGYAACGALQAGAFLVEYRVNPPRVIELGARSVVVSPDNRGSRHQ